MPDRATLRLRYFGTPDEQKPPSDYTQQRDAEKDKRQKILDAETKKRHEQLDAQTRASFELHKLNAEVAMAANEWKLREAELAARQGMKLLAELAGLPSTDVSAENRQKFIALKLKYPMAWKNGSAEKEMESWDRINAEAVKRASDARQELETNKAGLNAVERYAKEHGLKIKGVSLTEKGTLHPTFDEVKPTADAKALNSEWLKHHAGASGAAATVKRIEQENLDYAKNFAAKTTKFIGRDGKELPLLGFDQWLKQTGAEGEYRKAKAALDTHEAGMKTLAPQFQSAGTEPPAKWNFGSHAETPTPSATTSSAPPLVKPTSSPSASTSQASQTGSALPPIEYGTGGAKAWQDSTPDKATHVSINYVAPDGKPKSTVLPVETFDSLKNEDVSMHFPGSPGDSSQLFQPHPQGWEAQDYSHVAIPTRAGATEAAYIPAAAYKVAREAKGPVPATDDYRGQ